MSSRYDGFGRLASTGSNMGGASRTVSHLFDRDGRRVELTFPDQAKISVTRDGLGRAKEVWQGALGDTSFIMAGFAWNAAGRRVRGGSRNRRPDFAAGKNLLAPTRRDAVLSGK